MTPQQRDVWVLSQICKSQFALKDLQIPKLYVCGYVFRIVLDTFSILYIMTRKQ